MRWRAEKKSLISSFVRTNKRFAWTPTPLSNGDWIWFEFYYQDQVYGGGAMLAPRWITLKTYVRPRYH